MTREEARDQIVIFMCDEQKVINDRDKQALEMAIQALEQEPKYCDRNICMANEYNGIGCDECEVQEPTDENLHREREQAYMQGYEDASKRFRQEPSGDLISRQDAIKAIDEKAKRIKNEDTLNGLAGAVGILFDLPSVNQQEPCEDAISRQAVLETLDDMDNVLDEDRTIENYKELLKECYEVLPPVKPQEPKWNRLYSWLNDMRYGIAPDETVTDIDERNVRTAQVDLLDEIMEWMVEPQESEG